jgi:hypothetical protein
MAHGKSMQRVGHSPSFEDCSVHIPLMGAIDRLIPFESGQSPKRYVAALMSGRLVVSGGFVEEVSKAREVEPFPDKLIHSRRSAHGVTFGRMLGRSFSGRTKPSSKSVALKPFHNLHDAVNEMEGYLKLQDLGVPTFEPIGIFPAVTGSHVIGVTVKNNNLVSLDRNEWVVGRKVDSEESMAQAERNNQQVKSISETLAYIHANGVFHPDGQIKNFATTASDKIGIIDTEQMVVGKPGDENAKDLAWQDIDKLVKSLVLYTHEDTSISSSDPDEGSIFGVGMLAGLPLNTVRASIEELIVHPYLARLETMVEDAGPKIISQIEMLFDSVAGRFYEDETWPQHFIVANKRFS